MKALIGAAAGYLAVRAYCNMTAYPNSWVCDQPVIVGGQNAYTQVTLPAVLGAFAGYLIAESFERRGRRGSRA